MRLANHFHGDGVAHGIRQMRCQRLLQLECGAEMMQQIGMGAPHACGNGFQRHGLRACLDQQLAGHFQGCGPAFFGRQTALAIY